MSNNELNEQFVADEELSSLLRVWQTPAPPNALDSRVSSSYLREINALRNPVSVPQTNSEVVKMKVCSTCQEEFADKFSFCPVDGTPLNAAVMRNEEPSITVASETTAEASQSSPIEPAVIAAAASVPAVKSSTALVIRDEYHLTMLDDAGLASRLTHELSDVAHEYQLTWPEFKRDPIGFMKRSAVGYSQMAGRFLGNRNVLLALGAAVLALAGLVVAITLLDRSQSAGASRAGVIAFGVVAFMVLVAMFATMLGRESGAAVMGAQPSDSRGVAYGMIASFAVIFAVIGFFIIKDRRHATIVAQANQEELEVQQLIDIPENQPTPDEGTAGLAKGSGGGSKPKQEKAGGGGGGGREEAKPASFGKVPQADLHIPQVVAPDPHPPVIKNPALPMPATLDADPKLFPPDSRNLPYGDPKSKSTDPSSGPGKGNGIGTGTGGGIGSGEGSGYGPGRGGNTGGGDRNEGGGGAGGAGGGYDRVFRGNEVTQKWRVLSKPEPQYTEEARKNQITGTVVLSAVFTASGEVTQIRAVKTLPYGLTEKAIAAARLIKFVPAAKDGHQVSVYIHLEYNFNLY